jgi:hypothetical protein
MMARSTTRSNQRPDTLMQDRRRQFDEIFLRRTAGPYSRVKLRSLTVRPAGLFSPPEPGIDAKQPAVACDARPVDEFNPNRGREGKAQSHPCRSLKLGPIGACLIRAGLFNFRRNCRNPYLMRLCCILGALKKSLDVRTTRLRRPQAGALVRSAARVHRIPPRVRDDRDTPP